jgi:hypothetical protein
MDEMLFPDEALAVLRQARYNPQARRGLEYLTMSFHWSDEGLSQAVRACRKHDSRAYHFAMVLRTSVMQGTPVEEYRPTWDQLRKACPEWPGFRPQRCSPELLPVWQREVRRMCLGLERELRDVEQGKSQA